MATFNSIASASLKQIQLKDKKQDNRVKKPTQLSLLLEDDQSDNKEIVVNKKRNTSKTGIDKVNTDTSNAKKNKVGHCPNPTKVEANNEDKIPSKDAKDVKDAKKYDDNNVNEDVNSVDINKTDVKSDNNVNVSHKIVPIEVSFGDSARREVPQGTLTLTKVINVSHDQPIDGNQNSEITKQNELHKTSELIQQHQEIIGVHPQLPSTQVGIQQNISSPTMWTKVNSNSNSSTCQSPTKMIMSNQQTFVPMTNPIRRSSSPITVVTTTMPGSPRISFTNSPIRPTPTMITNPFFQQLKMIMQEDGQPKHLLHFSPTKPSNFYFEIELINF